MYTIYSMIQITLMILLMIMMMLMLMMMMVMMMIITEINMNELKLSESVHHADALEFDLHHRQLVHYVGLLY